MSDLKPEDVLDFWFGENRAEQPLIPEGGLQRWFQKSPEFDADIEARFGPHVVRGAAGSFDHWCETPEGRLALVVLIDQFARNTNRGKPDAFVGDAKTRELVEEAIASGDDLKLRPIERLFFYLPFEHAENLNLQNRCVALMKGLAASLEGEDAGAFDGFAKYAVEHQVIIEEFGRFPHRNAALGRVSTPAELEYLSKPGAGF